MDFEILFQNKENKQFQEKDAQKVSVNVTFVKSDFFYWFTQNICVSNCSSFRASSILYLHNFHIKYQVLKGLE